MEIKMVGIHTVKKRLADGSIKTHYYAWRGGPAMKEDPGSEQFMAEFLRLKKTKEKLAPVGNMVSLIKAYKKSVHFTKLKHSTKQGYEFALKAIEGEFGHMTYAQMDAKGARRLFVEWRDELAADHPRKADLYMSVLKRVLWFGTDREWINRNPLLNVGKINDETRRDLIWSDDQIAAFKASASEPLVRALMLALWTGQRQGDLLRLQWSAYDGESITLTQGKTNARVRVKVYSELKEMLDGLPKTKVGPILTNQEGKPWKSGFKSSWRKACAKVEITDRTFHDLRGTFVTKAYRKGASIKDIAPITGHMEKDAETIIRKCYLVSSAAIDKIEQGTASVNRRVNQ